MKKIIIILSLFCLFSKCTCSSDNGTQGSVSTDGNILRLKFDFDKDPVNIHDIGLISKVELLNLDCEEAIFGKIDKIIKHKNRIYLLDMQQTYSVFIYDTVGKFVNVIEDQGQGPNEYIHLSDIFINSEDRTLNLVSSGSKILKYDLDGNFLTMVRIPQRFSQISKIKNGYIGCMENRINNIDKQQYNIWTFSDKMELKEGFLEIDPTWNSKSLSGIVFSNYENKIYYITPLDFNVYCLNDDVFSVAYTFDFGKDTWPEGYKEFDKYKELLQGVNMGQYSYINQIDNFQETKNHLIAEVIHKGQTRLCVYNKQTGKSYIAEPDIYEELFISFGRIINADENAIYTLIEASNMKELHDGKNKYNDFEAEHPEQIKRIREKFPHIDEEGNPFLAIFYIK